MIGLAVSALLIGLLLVVVGGKLRLARGLADARTLDLDRQTLVSRRHGLVGRPDRLIREAGSIIPEEWKSSFRPRPWHRVQLGVYFLLVEEHHGIRPPYGYIVCGDGSRHRVENDDALRAFVLDLAGQIRTARRNVGRPIPVHPKPGRCRPCGLKEHCGQARL